MNCTMTLLSNSQKSLNDDSSYVGHTKVFYDDDVEIVTYEGVYNFRQFKIPFANFSYAKLYSVFQGKFERVELYLSICT